MSQQYELDAVSTTSSESTPRTRTLVVCFDAESVDFTKKSTIIQLRNSVKKVDGTIVYYAVCPCPSFISIRSFNRTRVVSNDNQSASESKLHNQLHETRPLPRLNF
jgi:uncharacterized protein (DUF2235 family)